MRGLGTFFFLLPSLVFGLELSFPEENFSTLGEGDRVGIEVEFNNLPLERAAHLVSMSVNGDLHFETYQDTVFIKDKTTGQVEKRDILLKRAVILNSDVGRLIIKPEDNGTDLIESEENRKKRILELVSDPISLDQGHHIQKALDVLVGAGALGTGKDQAVSLQVNVEIGHGHISEIDPMLLVELIREYSSKEARERVLGVLAPIPVRAPYIQEFSEGLLARVNQKSYNPTARELYDDLMYRQMLELMGDDLAWEKPIKAVQSEVLSHLNQKLKDGMDLGEAFFRVIKFSRIKLASVMIFLFPEDPLSKIIEQTDWIHPMPAIEFRERNNDFNVLEAIRMSVGFVNRALLNTKGESCRSFLTDPAI